MKEKVAIYCRLSEEDKNKQSITDESGSIQNQKAMLCDYAESQKWDIYGIYSDDDYAGADRNRPEFKRLLADAACAKCGYTEEGWFCAVIPTLLPKKRNGSTGYIKEIMYASLERFFMDKPIRRFGKCTVIFRHVYNRDNPKRAWRDHDNIEIKTVIDAIVLFVMEDDSPHICQHFYCSAEGDQDKTEVYVVPQEEFLMWFKIQPSISDDGLKLYDSPPQKQV